MEFCFPAGWYLNPEDNPYDLQCFSQFDRMNTGVFAYKKMDLAADATPLDIFREHVKDLRSKRTNFEQLEAETTVEHEDKTITAVTYLGDRDAKRFCYRMSLIEFRDDDSRFAIVLQVTHPGEWERNKPVLARITRSARPLPDRDGGT